MSRIYPKGARVDSSNYMPQVQTAPFLTNVASILLPDVIHFRYADLLERGMSNGFAQLPDVRLGHADQPGKVRIQRQLRVSYQFRVLLIHLLSSDIHLPFFWTE